MSKRTLLMFGFVLLLVVAAQGKNKERAWQTGKVLDSDRASKYAGNVGNSSSSGTDYGGGTYGVNSNSTSTAVYRVNQTYTIELGDYVYVAQERLRWRWSKPADLTINGPVKVAIEKKNLYLIGEDGREHEATITKKILKGKDEPGR